ncbi:LptA/OstA family protein [Pectinatus haikarae]|uniref:LptA/OstA family protein n=1 Tax=Pectinatus haikarae TaxID=349096 RepID=UPI0018C7CE1B|nr:LptA/OstA family protein [Pectinatus haikarae]
MRIRKIFYTLVLIMLFYTCAASASPKITADNTNFDILSGTYKLTGNVRVETDKFLVTAGAAQVNLTSFEVWAQKNIKCVYGGNDSGSSVINFSGSDLYGSWRTKTIIVKGGTDFSCENLFVKADQTSFNWETKIADFSGNVIVQQDGKTEKYDEIKYNLNEKKFLEHDIDTSVVKQKAKI